MFLVENGSFIQVDLIAASKTTLNNDTDRELPCQKPFFNLNWF